MRLIFIAIRADILLLILLFVTQAPVLRQSNLPRPAPQGYGVAVGYGLGGEGELDALGPVWYLDYRHEGQVLGQHPRLLVVQARDDLTFLSQVAAQNPGAWWQFGNEPNDKSQDNMAADEFAVSYHRFYVTLKRADPQALVTSAGIANADTAWAQAFREGYRSRFGRYPPIDGWSIHNYLLDRCEDALDIDAFKARIIAFRGWMERSSEAGKPLFLTEYGVLYGNGCCGCPTFPAPDVIRFMQESSTWLHDSQMVKAWAWFAVNTHNRYNGDLFEDGLNPTLFGQAFQRLVKQATDGNKDETNN